MIAAVRVVQGTRRYGTEYTDPIDWIVKPGASSEPGHMTSPGLSEMFAYHATTMANTIKTSLIVFSRKVTTSLPSLFIPWMCADGCPALLSSVLSRVLQSTQGSAKIEACVHCIPVPVYMPCNTGRLLQSSMVISSSQLLIICEYPFGLPQVCPHMQLVAGCSLLHP